MTTPVIRLLHQQTSTQVHYLVGEKYRNVLANNPHVHTLHTYPQVSKRRIRLKQWQTLVRTLRAEHYDCVLDLHNNARTWWLKRRFSCACVYGAQITCA